MAGLLRKPTPKISNKVARNHLRQSTIFVNTFQASNYMKTVLDRRCFLSIFKTAITKNISGREHLWKSAYVIVTYKQKCGLKTIFKEDLP